MWRYGTVKAGARLDSERRYVLSRVGRTLPAVDAVRCFLRFYGPAAVNDFAEWAGLARPHASRLWEGVHGELSEVPVGQGKGWVLQDDLAELGSPPAATGIRLIPPGDPYLQLPNRPLLAPDAQLRKRLFRPVAGPGAVLQGGRLAGLWRVKAQGARTAITVEELRRIARADLEDEAQRIADLRGAPALVLTLN